MVHSTEKYSFNFDKNRKENHVASAEMYDRSREYMKQKEALYGDYVTKLITAPLDSKIYLENETRIRVGSSKFINIDDQSNASIRYAYSEDANRAAKIIQMLFVRYMLYKNEMALFIQQRYRIKRIRRGYGNRLDLSNTAARVIQRLFLKRKKRMEMKSIKKFFSQM